MDLIPLLILRAQMMKTKRYVINYHFLDSKRIFYVTEAIEKVGAKKRNQLTKIDYWFLDQIMK